MLYSQPYDSIHNCNPLDSAAELRKPVDCDSGSYREERIDEYRQKTHPKKPVVS
jgi:hypothetical protein